MLRLALVLFGVGVCESVTVAEKFEVPVAPVGVPEITPAALSVSPTGNDPDLRIQVKGATPPEACRV
jgi:hypothetical protein